MKTKEIHNALKRRRFVNYEIDSIKEAIKILKELENEKKILDFELHSWDIFTKNK